MKHPVFNCSSLSLLLLCQFFQISDTQETLVQLKKMNRQFYQCPIEIIV